MYQNNQNNQNNQYDPYRNFQNNYNPQNPNQPNDNPYALPDPLNRGAFGNQARESNKIQEGEYYGSEPDLQASARNGFIRKVYSLVLIQLLVTAGLGYIAYNNEGFRKTFGSSGVLILVSVLLVVLSIVIACCNEFFRRYAIPIFTLFTLLVSLLVAITITQYKSQAILTAVVLTLVLVAGLTAYACLTKRDFTGMGPYLLVFALVLACFGFALIFWKNAVAELVYACLGALLFSIYLIFDTQLILGKGQYKFSMEDAYLAAIELYLDIINLFLFLLRIVGK